MTLNVTQFIAQENFSCNAVCMPLHRKQITTLKNYANVTQVNVPHSNNCHVVTTLLYPTVHYSTGMLISPLSDLLPDVLCLMVRIFRLMLVLLYIQGKVSSPVTGLEWPRGFQKLRFPDFMTTAQDGGKVVSLTHRPPLPPGNTLGTHFC